MSEPTSPIAQEKSALRAELSARRAGPAPYARVVAEEVVLRRLLALPAWQRAPLVAGYMSTRGELDLLPVWRAAAEAGKTYALPVTLTGAREGSMCFRATPGFCPERLTRGRFGIAEPPGDHDHPTLPLSAFEGGLILVPGLGFDADGFRIGYGGGYYDRFLDALAAAGVSVTTVGLCPAVCRVPRLPREAHDRAVDVVISE